MLKDILFNPNAIKQFSAVKINDANIKETVFLKAGEHIINITQRHSIACQNPFCLAVCITQGEAATLTVDDFTCEIKNSGLLCSSLVLKRIETFVLDGAVFAFFTIKKAKCHQLNFLFRYYILKRIFRKNNTTVHQRNIFAALYSYPRKIIVVSFRHGDYYNIFPMDFQCYIPEQDIYLLGLRTTNITLEKILSTKKIVVASTGTANLSTILSLGAHHSKTPPKIEDLPFAVNNSEILQFPVPHFADSYKEIELLANFPLGSHTLLVGKVIHEKVVLSPHRPSFYYLHFFQLVKSHYTIAGIC